MYLLELKVYLNYLENIETTKKTLPDFPGQWQQLLGNK